MEHPVALNDVVHGTDGMKLVLLHFLHYPIHSSQSQIFDHCHLLLTSGHVFFVIVQEFIFLDSFRAGSCHFAKSSFSLAAHFRLDSSFGSLLNKLEITFIADFAWRPSRRSEAWPF
jgi:hypothetical protein